ncbi:hypothetical protein D9M71_722970 [compost metagenome]
MKAEVHRQALGVARQVLVTRRHVGSRGDRQGIYLLADKAIAGHDGLALWALGELHQRPGPGGGGVRRQVEVQASRQWVVFTGHQRWAWQHRSGSAIGNRQDLGAMHRGQAAEANGLGVGLHGFAQLLAGLEALGGGGQCQAIGVEHQGLECFEGA